MAREASKEETLFNKVKRLLVSSLVFFTAFVLSNALMQSLIGVLSLFLKYTVKITYNKVYVNPHDYHYWNRLRVGFVFGIPPVVCLILGLFLFNYLATKKVEIGIFRMFLVWFMFCLINVFLGHLFISPIGLYSNRIMGFYQTFAIIGSWMGFNIMIMSVFGVIAIVSDLIFGSFVRNEILKFSHSSRAVKSSGGKAGTILQLYMLPICLAFLPIAAICTKDNFFPSAFMLINLIIISLGMLAKSFFDSSIVRVGKDDVLNHLPLFELLLGGGIWLWVFLYFK